VPSWIRNLNIKFISQVVYHRATFARPEFILFFFVASKLIGWRKNVTSFVSLSINPKSSIFGSGDAQPGKAEQLLSRLKFNKNLQTFMLDDFFFASLRSVLHQ
jgi:hypothetical protein